jgi:hypothetical protein
VSEDVVRVFVGTSANGEDAEAEMALEWSLKTRSSLPVEITWMRQTHDTASPWGGWDTSKWATPFSGFRWAIPAVCGFKGRAIYMDVDTVAVTDIAELWRMPMTPGKVAMARGGGSWRFCVSLWDCAAVPAAKNMQGFFPCPPATFLGFLKASPDSHQTMVNLFKHRPDLVEAFPAGQFWNYLDTEDTAPLSQAKVVHFTNMASQPHGPLVAARGVRHWYEASGGTRKQHPRGDLVALFIEAYEGALADGYSLADYIPNEPFGDYRKADLTGYRRGHAA